MHKAIASAWAQDKKDRKENLDKQIKKADERFNFLLETKKLKAKEAEIINKILGK